MPTRAQKTAAERAESKESVVDESERPNGNKSGAAPTDQAEECSADTAGRSLRKRRRREPTSFDHSPLPPPKRVKPRHVVSSLSRGKEIQDSTVEQAKSPSQRDERGSTAAIEDSAALDQQLLGGLPAHDNHPPDFNSVIADIINHGETVDNHYATRGFVGMGTGDNGRLHHLGASFTLKTQSLPVLDNLATQILEIIATSTYHEILTITTTLDTDPGQAYATLKSLFDHTKKVYSIQEPFLDPYELGLESPDQVDIIRKANMATFVSSVFGSQDVGFYHLNENFLDTFVADGSRLLKSQAQLLLELKTQAYISAVQNTERSREEVLEDLFPCDLEARLLKRRPGTKQLAPSEAEFIQRARNRRKVLLEEATNQLSVSKLSDKYVWEDFLRDISAFVSKDFEAIAGLTSTKNPHPPGSSTYFTPGERQERYQPSQTRQGEFWELRNNSIPAAPQSQDDIAEKAAQAANYAIQDFGSSQIPDLPQQQPQLTQAPTKPAHTNPSQQSKKQDTPQVRYHFEHPLHPNVPAPPPLSYFQDNPYQHQEHAPQTQQQWSGHVASPGLLHPLFSDQQIIPYPTQSASTQVLYERARMASTAKSSPSNRRTGHPSQRRPWTTEEESSLMAGLDRVKGPHWSQILAMFGPGGTINEVLKDRNQVQLKDKARNLKLFFLKSGVEVPYYLQFVTGELKTRAPAQAAKNEARQKDATGEDRAHVEGLMALAAGSSHERDQLSSYLANQQLNSASNGHIESTGMSIDSQPSGGHDVEVPIDPMVSNATAGGIAIMTTNAPPNGIAEMTLASNDPLQRQPQHVAELIPNHR